MSCSVAEGPDQGLSLSEEDRERSSRTMPVKRQRRRRCASLDNHNPWYEEVLEERRGLTAKNFIRTNMVCLLNSNLYVHILCSTYSCPSLTANYKQLRATFWHTKAPFCGRGDTGKTVLGRGHYAHTAHNSPHTHTQYKAVYV